MHTDGRYRGHEAVTVFPNIASYIGVPLHLADGSLYGTLCAADPAAHALDDSQANLLLVLARLLVTVIERERETTARRAAEDEARRSERRLQTVVQNAPIILFAVEAEGTIILWEGQGLAALGCVRSQFVQRAARDVYSDTPALHALLERARTDQVAHGEVAVRGRTFSVRMTRVSQDDWGEDRVIGVATDITTRVRTEAELRTSNARLQDLNAVKSHVVSIVSHEFRTALAGILGFSEIMRDEDLAPEDVREYAGDINADAQRLNRMITEMLDLDRLESGRVHLQVSPVNLETLISAAIARVATGTRHHTFRTDIDHALPTLNADADKVMQVLMNLLRNAVTYAPDGGEITVDAVRERDMVHLRVVDRGRGIPADMRETIFERYTRVETDATRTVGGTGLGLPIVRQIVELHGGRVWAESMVEEGSTFHVLLPVDQAAAPLGEREG